MVIIPRHMSGQELVHQTYVGNLIGNQKICSLYMPVLENDLYFPN